MRKFFVPSLIAPVLLASTLSLASPGQSQDLGNVVQGVAQALINQQLDKQAYLAAQSANTVSGYRNYLKSYPKGIYRSNAEQALVKLGASVDTGTTPPVGGNMTAAQEEASLRLSFSERVSIQRRLTSLGYDTRGADGSFGYSTRRAIAGWQRANRQSVTSYLTDAQVRLIARQSGAVVTPPVGGDNGGDGTYSAAQVEASLGLSRTQRITIQRQLTSLGYNTGGADGLWGSNTRTAIRKWQTANKVSSTGYVTAAQVRLIASQAGTTADPTPPGGTGGAALEESLLGLSSYEKADLQRRLTRLGYNTYGADGVFGRNSRTAIAGWQADEGLTVTGYLGADEVRKIRVETGG
jgi:peptidoglycan hydrolase-like protein with peptidoglycan-binding domain